MHLGWISYPKYIANSNDRPTSPMRLTLVPDGGYLQMYLSTLQIASRKSHIASCESRCSTHPVRSGHRARSSTPTLLSCSQLFPESTLVLCQGRIEVTASSWRRRRKLRKEEKEGEKEEKRRSERRNERSKKEKKRDQVIKRERGLALSVRRKGRIEGSKAQRSKSILRAHRLAQSEFSLMSDV